MSVVYSSALKNDRMQAVADLIAGLIVQLSTGTPSAGTLVIGTSTLSGSNGVLASANLAAIPASISGGVLTLLGVPIATTATAAGTAAKAELRNNAGVTIVSGLGVATTGTEIIIGNANITLGESLIVQSGAITHG